MSTRGVARRGTGQGPRRTRIRRASPRLAPVRAAAALVLLAAAAAIYGSLSSPAFALRSVEIDGLKYVAKKDVAAQLALSESAPNLVGLRTDALEQRIASLSGLTGATVTVALPDRLRVTVEEREPILVWAWNGHRFLVDRDGRVFADASAPGTTTAARAAAARLPIIDDRRADPAEGSAPGGPAGGDPAAEETPEPDASLGPDEATESPAAEPTDESAEATDPADESADDPEATDPADDPEADASAAPSGDPGPDASPAASGSVSADSPSPHAALGGDIDPFVFDAATRIASLTPAQVGSEADRLVVILDDVDGFSLVAGTDGWQAVFGFYSASIRSPELIPGQVRLLRSLLAGRENAIRRIVLADDHNGTYTTR